MIMMKRKVAVAVAVEEKTERPAPKSEFLPQFRVLIHNDDHVDAEYVVKTLRELMAFDESQAIIVMLEAHETKVVLLIVTHKERAELIQEQFRSKRLKVTIEPAKD
jgi:ATP-dependent Clp protease adaptor protein ClpS